MDDLLEPAAPEAATMAAAGDAATSDGAELRGSSFDYLTQPGTDLAAKAQAFHAWAQTRVRRCLLYTSPSPRDLSTSRMPSSA